MLSPALKNAQKLAHRCVQLHECRAHEKTSTAPLQGCFILRSWQKSEGIIAQGLPIKESDIDNISHKAIDIPEAKFRRTKKPCIERSMFFAGAGSDLEKGFTRLPVIYSRLDTLALIVKDRQGCAQTALLPTQSLQNSSQQLSATFRH